MKIVDLYTLSLKFTTSHFISGWRPMHETNHLLVLMVTDDGFIGVGEGTPYSTSFTADYRFVLKIYGRLEYKLFDAGSTINFGGFLALETALMDALAKAQNKSMVEVSDIRSLDS